MSEQDDLNQEVKPVTPSDSPRASDILHSFLYDAEQAEARTEVFNDIRKLHPATSVEQITAWLERFNRGIRIVRRDYGSEPSDIKLVDEIGLRSGEVITDRAVYLNGQDTIAVPLNFIGVQASMIGNANILSSYNLPEDNYIGVDDLPVVVGFEEGYHYIQEKRDGIPQMTRDISNMDDAHEQEVRSLIPKVIAKEGIKHYKVPKSDIVRKEGDFAVVSQKKLSTYTQLTPPA